MNGQEQLKLSRQLVLAVQPVREINPPDATICVNLHAQSLHVVRSVGAARKVGQVELDLVPALVQSHRHRADERLDAGRRLVVARPEAPSHVLVVEDLN